MLRRPVPVVAFSGPSGSGKTTLLVGLVRVLGASGIRVAAIKHSGHPHGFDVAGKDSDLLLRAGALAVAVQGPAQLAVFGPPRTGGAPISCRPSTWSSWRDGDRSASRASRCTGAPSTGPFNAPAAEASSRWSPTSRPPGSFLSSRMTRSIGWPIFSEPTSVSAGVRPAPDALLPRERMIVRYLD
jgi:hypothetical protein